MGRPLYLCGMERSVAVAAIFEPVQPPTTFEETVERLGTAIKLGLLPAGTRLPAERELAEELGISRSTLRQALTTLVQSGLLVSQRGRGGGTFVADSPPLTVVPELPSEEEMRSVLDYRVAVETGAAMLAAERATKAHLDAMAELVDTMAAQSGPPFEPYRLADIRFHIALAEACDSQRLVAAMTEVQGQMSELIALIPHPDEVLTRSNDQHRELVAAVAAGDGSEAARIVRCHLAGTEHILAGLMPAGG
jgi:GntR family transcriptional regulator, transcriptional repressor for pyruvate dehydrogenase complex